MPANLEALLGAKPSGAPFGIEDLKAFDKARQKTAKKYGSSKGARLDQLIAASAAVDVRRSNEEIKTARLYKISGNMLFFNVTASGRTPNRSFYQVRVRLEEWMPELTASTRPALAAKKAATGRLSFDCACGRHQFWYRYLATAGGFAVAPYEKDFPKIRNPNLTGCCCKHALKVLQTLKSPTVHAVLAKEMEKQAESAGFAGDARQRFITQDQHDRLQKARPGTVSQNAAAQAYKRYQEAQKAFSRHVTASGKALVKATAARRKAAPMANDKIRAELRTHLDMAKMYGTPRSAVFATVAKINNMHPDEVEAMAKGMQ